MANAKKNAAKASTRKTAKKTPPKAAKKRSATPRKKEFHEHVNEFLKAANKGSASDKSKRVITLQPLSQEAHVVKFNQALQTFPKTKGFEVKDISICDQGDPNDIVICSVNGGRPTKHRRSDCDCD